MKHQVPDFRDEPFVARVVHLILQGSPEKALVDLSEHFGIKAPRIEVGVVKRHKRDAMAVYVQSKGTIYASKSEYLYNAFVMLHEFYHHLRASTDGKRGTEKHADAFARKAIETYTRYVKSHPRIDRNALG